jgi:hypothetical protein
LKKKTLHALEREARASEITGGVSELIRIILEKHVEA